MNSNCRLVANMMNESSSACPMWAHSKCTLPRSIVDNSSGNFEGRASMLSITGYDIADLFAARLCTFVNALTVGSSFLSSTSATLMTSAEGRIKAKKGHSFHTVYRLLTRFDRLRSIFYFLSHLRRLPYDRIAVMRMIVRRGDNVFAEHVHGSIARLLSLATPTRCTGRSHLAVVYVIESTNFNLLSSHSLRRKMGDFQLQRNIRRKKFKVAPSRRSFPLLELSSFA